MIKLSGRLLMTASLIRQGKPIGDIGTDHAYLPVYLIQNNLIPFAVAGDLRKGPLENARATVERFGLTDRITLILSDGFKGFESLELESQRLTDYVIAGMGGNLIADILEASPFIREIGNHFVLQPQSHASDLREYLVSSGYRIIRERLEKEGRRLYIAIEAEYSGENEAHTKGYCYMGECERSDSPKEYREEYLNRVLGHIVTRARALEAFPDEQNRVVEAADLRLVEEELKAAILRIRSEKNGS